MSVYACSDLHGRCDLYQEVEKFLKPEDKIYCLGDCGDRGPDGWKLIKTIYNNPQFEYLIGNHEHMLACAMTQFKTGRSPVYDDAISVVLQNGGGETLQSWIEDGQDFGWIEKLTHLNRYTSYINSSGIQIILSHAGFTPKFGFEPTLLDLIWDRNHIEDKWPKDYSKVLIVHGHTPVQYITERSAKIEVCWYSQEHKADIDLGTYTSNKIVLLDLETFDEHYFKKDSKERKVSYQISNNHGYINKWISR